MPPPLDLTGRRFGQLTVLSRGPKVKWGKMQSSWVCLCDCGNTVTVPQNRLPHRDSIPPSHRVNACDDCRANPCVVCGAPVSVASPSNVCSPACAEENHRARWRRYYYHHRADDPGHKAARSDRAKRDWAALTDEENAQQGQARRQRETRTREEINAQSRKDHERRMLDPDYREKLRRKNEQWRAENPELARKRERDYARKRRAIRTTREMGDAAQQMIEDSTDE